MVAAVLVACALLALLAGRLAAQRADGMLRACATKMKGRAILLELHRADFGAYPVRLESLRYGPFAPCPGDDAFLYESTGTHYTLVCTGHHDATRAGWPRYTSWEGREDRPPQSK